MDIVVIGGGAGGATAAQFARKHDRNAQITIFEAGSHPQYSKCALPWVLSGDLSLESIIEFNENWFEKNQIDLHLDTPVKSVDLNDHIIATIDGTYEFDVLIIATGSVPVSPVKPSGRTFFLHTMEDARSINRTLDHVERAIIVGAGLVGLEAADALHRRGMSVSLVEYLSDILLTMVDPDMATSVRKGIAGVDMHFNHKVLDIADRGEIKVTAIDEQGNDVMLSADMVLIATGNRPNTDLFPELADRAIIVDKRCQTRQADVYAVGDCTQCADIFGHETVIGLGSVAVRQGMVAGVNAVGGSATMPPIINARTTAIFGMEIAAVGPISSQLDYKPIVGKIMGRTRPDYMPGQSILMKVLADKTGTIVGAQALGPEAAQRINKFAIAVQKGMSLGAFTDIETAYAPLVAPVFDVSSMACDIARRKIRS
jgi:NADH oxidase (H2O2-forming)